MERGFNARQTHRSLYPSIFNRLQAIARYWSEIATFSYPLHLTPPLGCSHWNSGKKFGPQKLESWGYLAVKTVMFDDRLSRFDTIPACDGRMDRRMRKYKYKYKWEFVERGLQIVHRRANKYQNAM